MMDQLATFLSKLKTPNRLRNLANGVILKRTTHIHVYVAEDLPLKEWWRSTGLKSNGLFECFGDSAAARCFGRSNHRLRR